MLGQENEDEHEEGCHGVESAIDLGYFGCSVNWTVSLDVAIEEAPC